MVLTLTGKTRHISVRRLFSYVLVMQVEVFEKGTNYLHDPCGGEEHPYEKTFWRNAKVEDFSELSIIKANKGE